MEKLCEVLNYTRTKWSRPTRRAFLFHLILQLTIYPIIDQQKGKRRSDQPFELAKYLLTSGDPHHRSRSHIKWPKDPIASTSTQQIHTHVGRFASDIFRLEIAIISQSIIIIIAKKCVWCCFLWVSHQKVCKKAEKNENINGQWSKIAKQKHLIVFSDELDSR